MFGQFHKGQIILERLYPFITNSTTGHLELILIRLYSSFSYMLHRYSTTFHILSTIMNIINLMQQQVNTKNITFEQLLAQVYTYYNEQIKPKLIEFDSSMIRILFFFRSKLFFLLYFRYIIKSIFFSNIIY